MQQNIAKVFLGLLRLSMGFVFFWAFIDKTFGLGFATTAEKAWLSGASPTASFLKFAPHGPFAEFYNSLSGLFLSDWLFMIGLFFVGTTLLLGIGVRLGTLAGGLMLALMYGALGLPPENNPFIDEHLVYVLVMGVLAFSGSGRYFGLGRAWGNTELVQKHQMMQ